MLPQFELIEPGTLAEALDALKAEDAVPLAGGTNLLVDMRGRQAGPQTLVDLGRLSELQTITRQDDHIEIGAGVTVADLLLDPVIAEDVPVLRDAASRFGGAMVRNAATVAGNICFGSPAADLAPSLLALDAEVVLANSGGSRTVALADFFEGLRQTACQPDEIVTALRLPVPPAGSASCFYKLGLRKGDAITVVGIAVSLSAENGACTRARIALGAVAPVVLRATAAEAVLEGNALTPELVDEAARQAVAECSPIDDIRATAEYRRHIVNVLTRRLVAQASDAIH
jgi:CO/xanthine dehydrogenase FAD-binding subunit